MQDRITDTDNSSNTSPVSSSGGSFAQSKQLTPDLNQMKSDFAPVMEELMSVIGVRDNSPSATVLAHPQPKQDETKSSSSNDDDLKKSPFGEIWSDTDARTLITKKIAETSIDNPNYLNLVSKWFDFEEKGQRKDPDSYSEKPRKYPSSFKPFSKIFFNEVIKTQEYKLFYRYVAVVIWDDLFEQDNTIKKWISNDLNLKRLMEKNPDEFKKYFFKAYMFYFLCRITDKITKKQLKGENSELPEDLYRMLTKNYTEFDNSTFLDGFNHKEKFRKAFARIDNKERNSGLKKEISLYLQKNNKDSASSYLMTHTATPAEPNSFDAPSIKDKKQQNYEKCIKQVIEKLKKIDEELDSEESEHRKKTREILNEVKVFLLDNVLYEPSKADVQELKDAINTLEHHNETRSDKDVCSIILNLNHFLDLYFVEFARLFIEIQLPKLLRIKGEPLDILKEIEKQFTLLSKINIKYVNLESNETFIALRKSINELESITRKMENNEKYISLIGNLRNFLYYDVILTNKKSLQIKSGTPQTKLSARPKSSSVIFYARNHTEDDSRKGNPKPDLESMEYQIINDISFRSSPVTSVRFPISSSTFRHFDEKLDNNVFFDLTFRLKKISQSLEEFKQRKKNLKKRLKELNQNLEKLNVSLEELNRSGSTNSNEDFENCKKEIEICKKEIKRREKEIENRKIKIEIYKKENRKIKIENCEKEIENRKKEIKTREIEIKIREEEIEIREEEIENHKKDIRNHKKDIGNHKKDIEIHKKEVGKCKKEIENCEKEIENHKKEIENWVYCYIYVFLNKFFVNKKLTEDIYQSLQEVIKIDSLLLLFGDVNLYPNLLKNIIMVFLCEFLKNKLSTGRSDQDDIVFNTIMAVYSIIANQLFNNDIDSIIDTVHKQIKHNAVFSFLGLNKTQNDETNESLVVQESTNTESLENTNATVPPTLGNPNDTVPPLGNPNDTVPPLGNSDTVQVQPPLLPHSNGTSDKRKTFEELKKEFKIACASLEAACKTKDTDGETIKVLKEQGNIILTAAKKIAKIKPSSTQSLTEAVNVANGTISSNGNITNCIDQIQKFKDSPTGKIIAGAFACIVGTILIGATITALAVTHGATAPLTFKGLAVGAQAIQTGLVMMGFLGARQLFFGVPTLFQGIQQKRINNAIEPVEKLAAPSA